MITRLVVVGHWYSLKEDTVSLPARSARIDRRKRPCFSTDGNLNLNRRSNRCVQILEGQNGMGVNKEHKEFHAVDMSAGWETPAGYPAGIQQKILSGGLDENNKRGTRSRLLRFAPGVYTTKPFVHDYW